MKNTLISIIIVLFMPGCALISDKGAELTDQALTAAEFTICRGTSIGSIRRHYGGAEGARIWKEFCNSIDDFTPIE